jgi:hypothetical protein
MFDTYLVNGTDLTAPGWWLEVAEGLQDGPEFRGDDIVLPGKHGTFDPHADPNAPRRRYGPGRITFRMGLLGVDPVTGAAPLDEDDLSAYNARLGELQRLFNARQLVIDHPRSDGTRRAVAHLTAPIRPVREPSSPWFGRFTAECTIPGTFWTDLSGEITVDTGPAGAESGTFLDLSPLACDGAITDAVLRFGPGNNPSLIQQGIYFQYKGVIGAGQELLVDTDNWDAIAGAGTLWQPDDTLVEYGPGPGWLELDPTANPFQVAFTHTGGSPMRCSITARRKHLTS